ncbi:MAG: ABC transporter permease [Thermoanaerobaculia bacterium]|nr:ABC transporter permease [Thermoanaerobaculia bacterium]
MNTSWLHDFRQALRSLLRAPGFTLIAVATLALAIGVNSSIFSVIDTVLLNPLPFKDTDRLVYVASSAPGSDLPDEFPSAVEFLVHYGEKSELLEDIASFNSFTSTLRAGDRIERPRMSAPTASVFSTLGVDPILGRLPTPEDESGVVVLSHALWTTWFAQDQDILGRSLSVSGEDRTVIGVMPEDFFFPADGTLLWFPRTLPTEIEPGRFGQRMVARMAPGVTPEQLQTELTALARQLPERFGGSARYAELFETHVAVVRPLEEELLGNVAGPLWILLGAMAIVLLIACVNVANLFLVRGERRLPDLAVRRALGAGRLRLIGTQLTEATIIAGAAGVLAVGLAWSGVPLLLRVAPANVPRLDDVAVTPATLVFTFGVCVASALLCGLLPALRHSTPNLTRLREGGRGAMRSRNWGRNLLVAAQTALALVLLIGSALLLRSFDKLRNVDPGYDTADIFTFQIAPEGAHLQDPPSWARFHQDFKERLRALPGVESVGIVENVPLDEGVNSRRFFTEDMNIEEDTGTLLSFTWATGDYFDTMKIAVRRGRAFTPDDHSTQLGNVLVSQSAADLMWPGKDAVGQRIRLDAWESWETVVGVVDDVLQYDFRGEPEPMVYFPLVGQTAESSRPVTSPAYVVKTPRAELIGPEIRALVREVAPNAPMYRQYTMEGLAADSMTRLSFTMLTLGIASTLALLLGIVGLYGVLSYAVAERTREIGLRMALGAEARRVRAMIVGQGAKVLLAGLVFGLAGAYFASRSLGDLLFGISSFDVLTYGGVSTLLLLVGLAAAWVPAWRASRVDPMVSLREE